MPLHRLTIGLLIPIQLLFLSVNASTIPFRRQMTSRRRHVTFPVLTFAPPSPWGILLLLPGGDGLLATKSSLRHQSRDVLMRLAPAFAKQGLKVVIPGPPSDQQRLSYLFRSSKEHREDLQSLMAELNGQSLPLWVAASSRGSISASWSADQFRTAKGMILLSPITQPPKHQPAVIVNPQAIKASEIPTMIISQRSDPCPVSPPTGAMELDRQLQGASAVELIQLQGNSPSNHSKRCSPLGPHGFGGQETQLMKIMTAWMNQSLDESSPGSLKQIGEP